MDVKVSDDERYDFRPDRLLNVEAIAIEKKTGYSLTDWLDKIFEVDVRALHALVWIMRKRKQPDLKWEDVQFYPLAMRITDSPEERAEALRILNEERRRTGQPEAVGIDDDGRVIEAADTPAPPVEDPGKGLAAELAPVPAAGRHGLTSRTATPAGGSISATSPTTSTWAPATSTP